MTLPNFLIIGSGRSGTTSLHEYLRQHPQVFMSPRKEPNYFAFGDAGIPDGPGAAWLRATSVTTREGYEALFEPARGARAIGEASPRYLNTPEAPARIRALIPDARLVAILRHPVDRVFSTYLANRRDGYDPAPTLEAALEDQERRLREGWPFGAFVGHGLYWQRLSPYFELFPRERLRVYLYEDLVGNPTGLMGDLLSFLDVDASVLPDLSQHHGRTGLIRNPIVRVLWKRSRRAGLALGPLLPRAWRDAAYAFAMRDLVRPTMHPATRAQMLRLYREDTLRLQDLLGRDLSAWLR